MGEQEIGIMQGVKIISCVPFPKNKQFSVCYTPSERVFICNQVTRLQSSFLNCHVNGKPSYCDPGRGLEKPEFPRWISPR